MKKLATCVVAITGFIGTSAFAADMGVPAAPPPAPVWNWTGWYAGVNLGASMGSVKTDFNAPGTITIDFGKGPGSTTANFGGSNTESPDGFIGGGQIGYNWQYSPLIVVGLEADFQGAIEKDHITLVPNPFTVEVRGPGFDVNVSGVTVVDYQTQIDWFGTVRARIGYVWGNGAVMSYLTAGLAYGEVKINGTNAVSTPGNGTAIQAIGHSNVNTGWTAGYGNEGRLGNSNWTWKVESLYMDLGTLDATGSGASFGPVVFKAPAETAGLFTHSRFTDWILRGGLNYKFY